MHEQSKLICSSLTGDMRLGGTRSAANGMAQKMYNWNTLNVKVLRKLGFSLSAEEMEACAQSQPYAIERVLKRTRTYTLKAAKVRHSTRKQPASPARPALCGHALASS
eukprot:scaffold106_cov380-Prasinococcus_capsulatus_cf.AAC.49